MKLLKMLFRLAISPVVLFILMGYTIGLCIVWVFDPAYDHDASIRNFKNQSFWLQGDNNG